jgi:2-oxoglutarate ferredoxin oxidoreductase subunit gamma
MNKASLVKFTPRLKEDGLLVMNSSLIDDTLEDLSKSISAVSVPADDLAAELGNPKIANMVVLGAYLQKRQILSIEDTVKCLPNVLAKRHHHMLEVNTKALYRGAEFATRYVLNH